MATEESTPKLSTTERIVKCKFFTVLAKSLKTFLKKIFRFKTKIINH